eukprot:COSAG01_NODE_1283_length_10920_cov_5.539507_5_plen_69_part_00
MHACIHISHPPSTPVRLLMPYLDAGRVDGRTHGRRWRLSATQLSRELAQLLETTRQATEPLAAEQAWR